MPMFDALTTGPLRTEIEDELTLAVTITRVQRTRLASGEYVEGPVVVAEDVPGAFTNPTEAQAQIAAAAGVKMTVRVLLPLGTDVRIGDVLTAVGSDDDGNKWTRSVSVTATDFPAEVVRVCAAVDTQLNVGSGSTT
jgi:hypothetical protein